MNRRIRFFVFSLFMIGLVVTLGVTLSIKSDVQKMSNQTFTHKADEILYKISDKLEMHARVLQSGVALFNATDKVTRSQWSAFTKTQSSDKALPGIQGMGVSVLVPHSKLSHHLNEIRKEGFQEYKIWPEGNRETFSSIIYIEPFSGRNLRAFGYDMLSETIRREAMERARDTNSPTISGKVTLVQETNTDIQAGTLMFAPIYRRGEPHETIEQRRASLFGWVYSPLRMGDLIHGILSEQLSKEKNLRIQIFDGEQPSSQNLLFESQPFEKPSPLMKPIIFNGHQWTLGFAKNEAGIFNELYQKVWISLIIGLLLTSTITLLIYTLLNTRAIAQQIADTLTVDIRKSEKRYHNLVESVPVIIYNYSIKRGGVFYSPRVVQVFGYPLQNFYDDPMLWKNSIHPDDAKMVQDTVAKVAAEGMGFDIEYRIRKSTGEWIWLRDSSTLHETEDKDVVIFGVAQDITARKLAEKTLQIHAQTLRELAGALATAEERERRRIAKVLHDDVQQLLVSARFQLNSIRKEVSHGLKAAVDKVDELLSLSLSATRSLSIDLNPPVLRDGDLAGALRWLGEWMDEKHGLKVVLSGKVDLQISEDIRVLLFQSVRELLFNIVKHAKTKVSQVDLRQIDQELEIRVSDHGVGFDPIKTKGSGGLIGGLGLVGIQERMDAFGGCMNIKSAPGKGSEFQLLLPLDSSVTQNIKLIKTDSNQPLSPPTTSQIHEKTSLIKIMLVDDHQVMREGLAHLFDSESDIKIIGEASNGEEAIEQARILLPDIILMDTSMPIMNGVEATKTLTAELPQIKIIGLSMYEEAEMGRNMRSAGAVNFLSKTGAPALLMSAIREIKNQSV